MNIYVSIVITTTIEIHSEAGEIYEYLVVMNRSSLFNPKEKEALAIEPAKTLVNT